MKIALFGQALFAKDVLVGLLATGHEIVGVYVPPDRAGGKPDPLAAEAEGRGLPLLRHKRFRRKGEAIPELVDEFRALDAELCVLAYVTVILPREILEAPPRGSLCFHPSLLPRFRGGSAIPWQIILGEAESGVTVFVPDAGVDTGPIVVQKGGVAIAPTDNAASLYYDKLYPLGVQAVLEAVAAVADGTAAPRAQDESRATHQGLVDDAVAALDWSRPAAELDRLIRGCDPAPGAHTTWQGRELRLHDGGLSDRSSDAPAGTVIAIEDGAALVATGDGVVSVGRVRPAGGQKQAAGEAGLAPGERLL